MDLIDTDVYPSKPVRDLEPEPYDDEGNPIDHDEESLMLQVKILYRTKKTT